MFRGRILSSIWTAALVAFVQAATVFQPFTVPADAAEQAGVSSPWKFGILADTQWSGPSDGQSPNSIPAGIIKQIDREFIRHGVRFVVAVGDTVDKSNKNNIDARALYAQDLYNARIGYYPLRGNHEASWGGPTGSGPEFQSAFPQTRNGVNNATPAYAAGLGVDNDISPDPKTNPETFVVGSNFSSPDLTYNGVSKAGLTYSFDYNDARCIILDQWNDFGSTSASTIPDQQPWIDARLADPQRPRHAFVFGHKCLLGPKNKNNLFGNPVTAADPGDGQGVDMAKLTPDQQTTLKSKQAAEDAFIGSLAAHNVHFFICGHDHLHFRSIVNSPNGSARVHQIVGQSASSKFNWPLLPLSTNEIPIAQDLYKVGYYICTVDGPRVSVDYYAAAVEPVMARTSDPTGKQPAKPKRYDISKTPDFTGQWRKLETFGYSLNGREFLIPQGQSYTSVQDSTAQAVANGETGYLGTEAKILAGINQSTAVTHLGKATSKVINTGWSPAAGTLSDVFTLWGTATVSDSQPDTFVLALSFHAAGLAPEALAAGRIALVAKDATGTWINAVDANVGGEKKRINGDYDPTFKLGTFGVNTVTGTAWAVINHSGEFAVARLPGAN